MMVVLIDSGPYFMPVVFNVLPLNANTYLYQNVQYMGAGILPT